MIFFFPTPPFTPPPLSSDAAALLAEFGRNELQEKKKSKLKILGKLLISPMAIALWIAIVVEIALLDFVDVALLAAIQFANAGIAFYETVKVRGREGERGWGWGWGD